MVDTMLSAVSLLLILAVAMFVIGVLATVEDELPSGFDNPDGTMPPSALTRVAIGVVRWDGAAIGATMGVAFLVSACTDPRESAPWSLAGLGGLLLVASGWLAWRRPPWGEGGDDPAA
jgi:hypothetical protein